MVDKLVINHCNGPRALWLEIPPDPRCDEQATMSSEGNLQDAHSSSSLSKGLDHPSGLLFSCSWVHFLDVWILYIIFVPFWPILEEYMANIFLIDSFFLRFWDSMQLPQINSWLRASSWGRFSPPCWSTWLAPGSLASERESSKVLQSLSGANAPSDPGLSAFLLQMLWIVDIDWILADRYIYRNVVFIP